MRKLFFLSLFLSLTFLGVQQSSGATVTCEVQEVHGDRIVLVHCDEQRAKGFKPGSKVKLKTISRKK